MKWGVADAIAALPMSCSRYSKFWHGAAGGGRGKLINAVEYARDIREIYLKDMPLLLATL